MIIFCCKTWGLKFLKRLAQILEIGGLILRQTWLAGLMNTSGTDGILDGFFRNNFSYARLGL